MYNFFITIWISTLLSATVGVSVRSIYCYCTGKTSVALFASEKSDDSCCTTKDNSCCGVVFKSRRPFEPCKSSKAHYVQLKLDFSTENSNDFSAKTIARPAAFGFDFAPVLFFLNKLQTAVADRAPPSPYGKSLLPFVQVWLI